MGTKGKARTTLLDHSSALVEGSAGGPSWNFIYAVSTVKDQGRFIGDRVVLPDGRVFRYAKSGGVLVNDLACAFAEDEVQGYEVLKNAQAIGDTEVVFTGASHAALTENELRGGYILIFRDGGGGKTQFRGIVGNPVSAGNANITVYLDASLDQIVVAGTTAAELFYNPYANLQQGNAVTRSKAGKPAVQVNAANTYFWVQTWGPCWISPQGASFGDNNDRGAWFRHDGSIEGEIAAASKNVTLNSTQYAGFLINEGYSTGPMLMLQISP